VGPPPISQIRVPEDALGLLVVEGGILGFPILSETARVGRYDPVTGARPEIESQPARHPSLGFAASRPDRPGGRTVRAVRGVGSAERDLHQRPAADAGRVGAGAGGDKLGFGNITLVFKSPEKAGRRRF